MGAAMMAGWKSVVGADDTVLNGGDVALAGSLDKAGRAEIRAAPGRKLLVVGNHDFNRKTGLLDAAGHGAATGILAIDTDPPMVLSHVPMDGLPAGWVNLYGHVHNNEPCGTRRTSTYASSTRTTGPSRSTACSHSGSTSWPATCLEGRRPPTGSGRQRGLNSRPGREERRQRLRSASGCRPAPVWTQWAGFRFPARGFPGSPAW